MPAVLSATRRGAESPDSEIVSLPSGDARVEWRRHARARRVSLRIDPSDGAIVVTLPPRASRRAGMALLMGHVDWVAKRIAALLETEGVAYDIAAHRDSPPGLRIWTGATIETANVIALLPWLDWAYATAEAEHTPARAAE